MPHPEHAVEPALGGTDGAVILGSLIDHVQGRRSRPRSEPKASEGRSVGRSPAQTKEGRR
jgi:hypothetical protein